MAPGVQVFKPSASASQPSPDRRLSAMDADSLHGSKAARMLSSIRRDMDLKYRVFEPRRRNEEILSLAYNDGTMMGGSREWERLKQHSFNLPYRYARWIEAQATSKKLVVKVSRDAGAGQRPGGPSDAKTSPWVSKAIERVAYEAGFTRETRAVVGEMIPLGTSVIAIGYHQQAITAQQSAEVGKDAQSVIPEVLTAAQDSEPVVGPDGVPTMAPVDETALEAKDGQAHAEIAEGLTAAASDPMLQASGGKQAVDALLARAQSHTDADYAQETQRLPIVDVRERRHRIWMQKRRVGEDCGWSPSVYDIEDAGFWWDRRQMTVAEAKVSPLFSENFKAAIARGDVRGYDARNTSGVARGGQTPGTENMGSDARQAQSEDVLDEDERIVEYFILWCRRPEMKSGGLRKIVCAEFPDEFVEADEANPHIDPETGFGLIPGFYPFYDFTPLLSSLPVPERTCGLPPIGVGMPQFEQIQECNRMISESARRHAMRLYQLHPALKGKKRIQDALRNAEDGFSFVAEQAMVDVNGNMKAQGVLPIQFSGNTIDIERLRALLESDWIKVMGMPPAVLQGVGTAGTLGQDQMGLAAGERESGALVSYLEQRMGDVFAGIRGLMRGCYDTEDYVRLLGTEGATVMTAWAQGTDDYGDQITVTFGATAQAAEAVHRKQLMEAITLLRGIVDPTTGLPIYDTTDLIKELCRSLDVGDPQMDQSTLAQLQKLVVMLMSRPQAMQPQTTTGPSGGPPSGPSNTTSSGGPNPSEGAAPDAMNIHAGASRGTVSSGAVS